MRLYMPVKVYFEENAVKNRVNEWSKEGSKAMIVTGKHSSRTNGSLKDVTEALSDVNIPFVIFDDIEENPSVETVVKAAKLAVNEKVDFFIGIGGGSPMDASKAISILTKNSDEIENARTYFYEYSQVDCYPIIEVPTTSGTGSEVTSYSILTIHDSNTKKGISKYVYPKFALIDYRYLKTSSYNGMVSCCTDALAHLIEAYLNTNANIMNRLYSKEGLTVWGKYKECLLNKVNFENMADTDYEGFMHASILAGMAIAHTGTSVPHGLSYPVTYELGVPHGKACGIFLPAFLKTYDAKEEVGEVLNLLGFRNVDEFDEYMKQILGHVEIAPELFERDMNSLVSNPAKLKHYPFEITKEKIEEFKSAFTKCTK